MVVGIEGAGSYGAGLCRHLQRAGDQRGRGRASPRRDRRAGKSDRIDALLAAKRVLAGDGVSTPRADGDRSALGVLLVAYRSCVEERTRLLNQLQGLHVTAPASLRERIGHGSGARLAERLVRMRDRPDAAQEQTMLAVLRDLARRARQLGRPGRSLPTRDHTTGPGAAPSAAGRARCRPDQRRQAPGLRPGTLHERSRICALQRHRTATRILRPNDPPPTLPRRRPPSQQRDPHDRHEPIHQPRRVTRLPQAQNQRRQNPPRSDALTQTTRLPPPLPPTLRSALDTIEASENASARI